VDGAGGRDAAATAIIVTISITRGFSMDMSRSPAGDPAKRRDSAVPKQALWCFSHSAQESQNRRWPRGITAIFISDYQRIAAEARRVLISDFCP